MRTGPLGLGPFLETLEDRLDALWPDEIRRLLLAHARRLPSGGRESFLRIFPAPGDAAREVPSDEPPALEALVECIDGLVERLRDGEYCHGWGWDPDVYDERAFGDESWTDEMDELFAEAKVVFLDGDLVAAREAYGPLLRAFGLDEEGPTFPGPMPAQEMVLTDVPEAKARFLRATYETVDPPERAVRLAEELEALARVGGETSLGAVADALPDPLPGLEAFLPSWIERLSSVAPDGHGFGRQARRLLAEAVELRGGTDGLGELARLRGTQDPEAFWDWIAALTQSDRAAEAAAACNEALDAIDGRGAVRARIAEHLAGLLGEQGDAEGALEAVRKAWRAAPATRRLLALRAAAEACGKEEEVLAAEADAAGEVTRTDPGSEDDPRLACEVLLLAERVDEAVKLLERSAPLGWSRGSHPGPVVVPFLLAAAASGPAKGSALLEVFHSMDDPRLDPWTEFDDGFDAPRDDVRLSSVLLGRLEGLSCTPADRGRWLATARRVVEERVAEVVEAKYRRAYARVARLGVACAEAVGSAEGSDAGRRFVTGLRERYPRHVAFKRELDAAVHRSAALRRL